MTGTDAIRTGTTDRAGRPLPDWTISPATPADVGEIATAVCDLLRELGAEPPAVQSMEDAARAVIHDPSTGAILVASTVDGLVGVLGASWQTAVHAAGRYAVIQDLWVAPAWRGHAVGRGLVEAFAEHLRRERIACVEVGLPRPSFPGLAATEAFYRARGFAPVGPRMRWRTP